MNWKISLFIIFISFSSCTEIKQEESTSWSTEYLVEVADLKNHLKDSTFKVLDFRKESEYSKGHIKGAVNVWRTDIEDTTFAYAGMMASSSQIEALFNSNGINTGDTIIVYDDNGLCDASRLWWVLQNYDYNAVKLLHGGYSAWVAAGGANSTTASITRVGNFKLASNPSMKYAVSKEDVLTAVNNNRVILDTRTEDEFSGKRQKNGAAKGGRIPASVRIDWAEAIDYNGDKRIKSLEELQQIYGELKNSKEEQIVVYCHSGVRSAHTSFVLTQLLGYSNVKNYDGSWVEWSHIDSLPFIQDSTTTLY